MYRQKMNHLGKTAKAARKEKGWTQIYLAPLLDITPRYLKAIENSGRNPGFDLFTRMIYVLEIPAEELFITKPKGC